MKMKSDSLDISTVAQKSVEVLVKPLLISIKMLSDLPSPTDVLLSAHSLYEVF